MLVHRSNNGVEYLDRGDYVEILSSKRKSCATVKETCKGRYFLHQHKRIYIKGDNDGKDMLSRP